MARWVPENAARSPVLPTEQREGGGRGNRDFSSTLLVVILSAIYSSADRIFLHQQMLEPLFQEVPNAANARARGAVHVIEPALIL